MPPKYVTIGVGMMLQNEEARRFLGENQKKEEGEDEDKNEDRLNIHLEEAWREEGNESGGQSVVSWLVDFRPGLKETGKDRSP